MTVMEYFTRGWDLAIATGPSIPYAAEDAEATLARAIKTLPTQYRGKNMAFGNVVEVADTAPAIDRLVGFLGRQP